MAMSEKASVPSVSSGDIQYLQRQIDELYKRLREDVNKKIRMIMAILVDKKLVSEEIAKVFMESKEIDEKKLDWLLRKLNIQ